MSDTLNVALVGAAGKVAAPCHLRAWRMVDRGRLAAVCDVDQSTVQTVATEWGVGKVYADYSALLADPGIDAVDIVTPPFLHAEMTEAAARAGKHVYVEKPMARSTGEARRMIEACQRAGVRLMVGESYVFTGSHMLARELIDAGEIGDVAQVRQTKGPWVMREDERRRLGGQGHFIPWRVDPVLSGGGDYPWLMDHGAHFFATARYLAHDRSISTVSTLARAPGIEEGTGGEARRDSVFSVAWRYADGDSDGIWTRVDSPPGACDLAGFRSEVYGDRGMIRVFGEGGGATPGAAHPAPVTLFRDGKARSFDPADGEDRVWRSNVAYYDRAHASALAHFAAAVLDGSPLRYDGESGRADIAATLAAIKSAIDARPVDAASVPDDWTAYANRQRRDRAR